MELQAEYAAWLDALPDNQQDSALADALRTIVEFDLSELQASNRHAASAVIEQRDGPTAWATMTRAAAYRHQPVSAGTAR